MFSSSFVTGFTTAGAPELTVQNLNKAGHAVGHDTEIVAGPAGSRVIDPELTRLVHGGEVLTWIDAYSNGPTAHYAVLNPGGKVVAEGTYGSGAVGAFEAVALPNGGFALADGQTDLFGQLGTITFQDFNARGVPTGEVMTVASESGHGLYFADLEGAASPADVQFTWTEPSGAHSAVVELPSSTHGHHADPGLFLT